MDLPWEAQVEAVTLAVAVGVLVGGAVAEGVAAASAGIASDEIPAPNRLVAVADHARGAKMIGFDRQ